METPNMKLQGKIALVTGASRGIGRAIAWRLANDGAKVIVHYNTGIEAAQAVVEEIEQNSGEATFLAADLGEIEDARRLAHEVAGEYERLDILVNNAGWADFKTLDEADEKHFDAMFNLNVRGLFFLTQEAACIMNDGGRIINISSGITRANAAGGSVYAASKAAVEALTRCWAAELGPRGITVNTVSPGMTETDLLAQVTSPEVLERVKGETPLRRLGQPDDIADVVAFLCSDDGRWMTANNLLANGGMD
jgi:3-oxoacyl-[acyl-carrier protein] reductase